VLYEMVVGQPPFEGENPVSIAYQHVREEPTLPTVINPTIPKSFEAIVMKAMAKNADDRYPSADALRADLLRFQLGQGVLAPDVSPTMVAATSVVPRTPVEATRAIVAGVPPPPESRNRNRLYAGLLIALLIVLAALVFFLGHQLGWWAGTSKLTVPGDVAGKTVDAAKTELAQDGFTNVSTTSQPSATVAANVVTGTTPPGGTKLAPGGSLVLMVSSGPAPVGVPNVVNQTQQAAETALKAKGFKTSVSQATSLTVPAGNVISTSPAAGQSEVPGTTIALTVSSGVPQVTIPSLSG
jgi:hypothetical protein